MAALRVKTARSQPWEEALHLAQQQHEGSGQAAPTTAAAAAAAAAHSAASTSSSLPATPAACHPAAASVFSPPSCWQQAAAPLSQQQQSSSGCAWLALLRVASHATQGAPAEGPPTCGPAASLASPWPASPGCSKQRVAGGGVQKRRGGKRSAASHPPLAAGPRRVQGRGASPAPAAAFLQHLLLAEALRGRTGMLLLPRPSPLCSQQPTPSPSSSSAGGGAAASPRDLSAQPQLSAPKEAACSSQASPPTCTGLDKQALLAVGTALIQAELSPEEVGQLAAARQFLSRF